MYIYKQDSNQTQYLIQCDVHLCIHTKKTSTCLFGLSATSDSLRTNQQPASSTFLSEHILVVNTRVYCVCAVPAYEQHSDHVINSSYKTGGLPVEFLVAAGYWPATGHFGNRHRLTSTKALTQSMLLFGFTSKYFPLMLEATTCMQY
jgi:hypothetical protein